MSIRCSALIRQRSGFRPVSLPDTALRNAQDHILDGVVHKNLTRRHLVTQPNNPPLDGLPSRVTSSATSRPLYSRLTDVTCCLSDTEIRSWALAKAYEHRRFALALPKVGNSVAPIHRFPRRTPVPYLRSLVTRSGEFPSRSHMPQLGSGCTRHPGVLARRGGRRVCSAWGVL
ncbi:hypothetical protein L226DRAFT_306950 [Lentinus tigrinus ALCF2SS1-7]|uniref:uncharacterized protein n=1 Tax=Lentinus tigrinus ALCF2SS1-7 TaxID=1328758 RepID=UPI001165E01D|nr:hypothetical protein L226DRAFT_306950 [Lentinus tigrinus ALCF2SS1-7]